MRSQYCILSILLQLLVISSQYFPRELGKFALGDFLFDAGCLRGEELVCNQRVLRSIDASGSIVRIVTKINATFNAFQIFTDDSCVSPTISITTTAADSIADDKAPTQPPSSSTSYPSSCSSVKVSFKYEFILTSFQASKLSYIGVEPDDPSFTLSLSAPVTNNNHGGMVSYTLHISSNDNFAQSRSSTERPISYLIFSISTTYPNILELFPSKIEQLEDQRTILFENHYFYSPYRTHQQKTIVKLASDTILDFTKKDPSKLVKGNTIVYGPYEDVPGFSISMASIHFINNKPFKTFLLMHRDVDLSHWGRARIEDIYNLHHHGAPLKVAFRRLDHYLLTTGALYDNVNLNTHRYTNRSGTSISIRHNSNKNNNFHKNSFHHFFQNLPGHLPAGAYGLYHKDQLGSINVSSSIREPRNEEGKDGEENLNLDTSDEYRNKYRSFSQQSNRNSKKKPFSIATRFPLFGGWSAQFYLGFFLPVDKVVKVVSAISNNDEPDVFEFRSSINTYFDDIWVQQSTFNLILPIGAVVSLDNVTVLERKGSCIENCDSHARVQTRNNVVKNISTRLEFMFPAVAFGPMRQVVTVEFRDLVQDHDNFDILVRYSYPLSCLFQLPAQIAAIFFFFFALLTLLSRLSVSG